MQTKLSMMAKDFMTKILFSKPSGSELRLSAEFANNMPITRPLHNPHVFTAFFHARQLKAQYLGSI
jgi:hypothetical protein